MNLVLQKEDKGCVIACIAMILGKTYDEVRTDFYQNFNKKGINANRCIDYICEFGYSVVKKEKVPYHRNTKANLEMIKPFADSHIVIIQEFFDNPVSHAIVMDSKGHLLCPENQQISLKEVYSVNTVFGFYKNK